MNVAPTRIRKDAGLRAFFRAYFDWVAMRRLRIVLVHALAAAAAPLACADLGMLPTTPARVLGAAALLILVTSVVAAAVEWRLHRQLDRHAIGRAAAANSHVLEIADPASRRTA